MNWDAAGAIGEIIGAVAVVATLAFLAAQIRQSHRLQRDSNVLARSAAINKVYAGFRRVVAADPDVTRVWVPGCADEKLEQVDQERFRLLAIDYLVIFANWEQSAVAVNIPSMAEAAVR
jgi:hypothetical protein